MSALPHGLTEPLHFFPPSWLQWRPGLGWLLAALTLALALIVSWHLRRRPAPPPPEPSAPPIPAPRSGVLEQLATLRRRHAGARSYRQGCHELSELLRGHLESTSRRPFLRWTAREAARAEGDTVWTRLLGLLSELQFSRHPPADSDFEGMCDLARDALGGSER